MTVERVSRVRFPELFDTFSSTAWRWECQGEYHEPDEAEPFAAWKVGHPDDSFLQPWCEKIRKLTGEGKTFGRVRMLTEPLTEYLEWMLSFTHLNIDAGEDIRWIAESTVTALPDRPRDDFYIFDDVRVATLLFDENGVCGAEVTDDRDSVQRALKWRHLVSDLAIPHSKYLTDVRSV